MPRPTATLIVAGFLWTTGNAFAQQGRSPAPSGNLLGRFYPVCSLRSRAGSSRKFDQRPATTAANIASPTCVGTRKATFTLAGFTRQEHDDIVLTSGFTAPVNATLTVGQLAETVTVVGTTPTVDVQRASSHDLCRGRDTRAATARNIRSLLTLTPGLTLPASARTASGAPASGATTTSTTWPPTPRPLTLMP